MDFEDLNVNRHCRTVITIAIKETVYLMWFSIMTPLTEHFKKKEWKKVCFHLWSRKKKQQGDLYYIIYVSCQNDHMFLFITVSGKLLETFN